MLRRGSLLITTADLKTQTRRDLAGTARDIGIAGWHAMKKEELIDAIRKAQAPARSSKSTTQKSGKAAAKTNAPRTARSAGSVKSSGGARPSGSGRTKASAAKAGAAKSPTKGKGTGSAKPEVDPAKAEPVSRKRHLATKQPAKKDTKAIAVAEAKPGSVSKPAAKGAASRSSATKSLSASKSAASKLPASKGVSSKGGDGKAADHVESSVDSKAAAPSRPKRSAAPERKPTSPEILKVLRRQQASAESRKDLSACVMVKGNHDGEQSNSISKERIVLIVRDSYWLQASWAIARSSIERARAAMGADWHSAEPVLRLLEVAHGASANTAEQVVRDIPIHGGVNNWYIDVDHPPSRYRVLIGYRSTSGRFYTLFRSNIVLTPEPGACDPIDGHWQDIAEDYERIYSLSDNDSGTGSNDLREMFEERLQRPMVDFKSDPTGLDPDLSFRRERDLPFEVDAELIVYGSTAPGASVTLDGSPVRLRPDGTFTVRMELPDRRRVIPVMACSRDGLRQRTTVVSVERNTKVMEPVSRNQMD